MRLRRDDAGEEIKRNIDMIEHRITRRELAAALAATAAGLAPIFARAQPHYPVRPVRFILPFGAAGVADITARIAAEKLGDKLGQRFVVENQPGPGGIAAARSVLSQPADGYTIGLVTNGTSISAAIYNALPFDPLKDFATVSAIGYFALVFASNVDSELRTMADFMAAARAQPGKLNVGTINVGGTQNLAAELLKSSAGLDFQIIPYRGTPGRDRRAAAQRRPADGGLLRPDESDAAGQEDAPACHYRRAALAVPAGRADRRGSGRAGIRGDVVERNLRAHRDAGGDHRCPQQGDPRSGGDARREAALRRPRHRGQS